MQSIGVVFKKDEMIIVSLKQGIREIFLEGYRILPFLDFKEGEKEEAIIHNLERFLNIYKGGRDNIFIALPRDAALLQFLYLPAAVEENLRATLGYEIDKHTPFSFDDVYFDFHVLRRIPESNLIQVMLITVKKDLIDYYLTLFKKINGRVRGIEITTTALMNVVQTTQAAAEEGAGALLALNKIPLPERYLKLLENYAPRVARLIKTPDARTNTPAVTILVEYLDKQHCELDITDTASLHFSQVVPCSAAANPDGSPMRELYTRGLQALIHLPAVHQADDQTISFVLSGSEMERDALEHIPEDIRPLFSIIRDVPVRLDKHNSESLPAVLPLLAVPIGAGIKGITSVPCDINFIPPLLRPKRKRSKRKILAAACMVVLLLAAGGAIVRSTILMQTKLLVLNEEVGELKKQVLIIEAFQQEAKKLEQVDIALKGIRDSEISKIKLLEELTKLIPEDSWLTECQYSAAEKKIKVSGYAVSASKLVPLLEDSTLFENVKFTSPITIDKRTSKERFRLEMNVSGGANKP